MLILTTWILASALAQPAAPTTEDARRIDVDCGARRALQHALARARKLGEVDIYLHGVCEGHFVIDRDGLTLRGATKESGLAAPPGDTSGLAVLEVINAQANLRGLVVRGGALGVFARGWDAEVLLVGVNVEGQDLAGVVAHRGAYVRLIDSMVRDGYIGITAQTDGTLNLQNVVVTHQQIGVIVYDKSYASLSDTTIANNSNAGLSVDTRSDANVLGSVFRENGEVHVNASDGSSVNLLFGVTIGSEQDPTSFSLTAGRNARMASFSAPVLHGDVGVLDGASIRMGNTVLDGDLLVLQFADAYVREATITGSVYCYDGSDAICSQTTSAGVFGCSSLTCGPPGVAPEGRVPKASELPKIEVPRFEAPPRVRSRQ